MARAKYLNCPSCTGSPKGLSRGFQQCINCGYIAPTKCFESPRENAKYRLQFNSAIFAESAEDSEKYLRSTIEEDARDALKELKKEVQNAKK